MITLSDKQLQGFFDADGTISITVVDRRNKTKTNSKSIYGFDIKLSISQTTYRRSILEAVSYKLGGKIYTINKTQTSQEHRWSAIWTSTPGQNFVKILSKNKPLLPNRRNDFLIAKEIRKLLQNSTIVEIIAVLHLVYQTSNEQKIRNTKSTVIGRLVSLQDRLAALNATTQELSQGKLLADQIYNNIRIEVEGLENKLVTKKLSKDYMAGFMWGDGGWTVVINKKKDGFYIFRPYFTITEPSKALLTAFQNTFGEGTITGVGPIKGNCFQFRITSFEGIREKVLPMFKDMWHPPYCLERIKKMMACVELQSRNLHLTVGGWEKFIELCYDMCENSKRPISKEQLLVDGISQINKRKRQFKDTYLEYLRKKHNR